MKLFSASPVLSFLLQPLSPHYQPPQIDSIAHLLLKLADSANIYLKVQNQSEKSETKPEALLLSEHIIKTSQFVQKQSQPSVLHSLEHFDTLSMNQKYQLLLKDLRFGYMDMKENGQQKHHYLSHVDQQS